MSWCLSIGQLSLAQVAFPARREPVYQQIFPLDPYAGGASQRTRAHRFVIDGESYRKRAAPGSARTRRRRIPSWPE
jgi:hypothetical protein